MKTRSFLTIVLAVVSAFVLSQPGAIAKSSTSKTAGAKKHHKKHMKKTASTVAPVNPAAPAQA
jgi:hypothetical protein